MYEIAEFFSCALEISGESRCRDSSLNETCSSRVHPLDMRSQRFSSERRLRLRYLREDSSNHRQPRPDTARRRLSQAESNPRGEARKTAIHRLLPGLTRRDE